MLQFLLSGLLSGLRGRSFHAVFALGLVLIGVAYLSGYFSPRQPQTVALDVGLSGLRFSLVLLNLFWIQELVAREIDRRTIVVSLAYPVARGTFLLGRFLAVVCLSSLALAAMGLLLGLAVLLAGQGYEQQFAVSLGFPYLATLAGLLVDVAVTAAFALLVSTFSTVNVLPLALGAAFAVAGKSLGAVVDYLTRGADGDAALTERFGPLIDTIRWLLPDLSRMDWRNWPMYGVPPGLQEVGGALVMGLAYMTLLLSLAVIAFGRREFN